MVDYHENIINAKASIKEALEKLNNVPETLTLFVTNEDYNLEGTLTDGDIRRGVLNNKQLDGLVEDFMFKSFRYVEIGKFSLPEIDDFRQNGIKLLPILDKGKKIVKIIDLTKKRSLLPVDAIIMAGGEGKRLRPLTLTTPKPLLIIGDKPIIEHNIDRLSLYGIQFIHISIKYHGDQIISYLKDGKEKGLTINYVSEEKALGTLGAAKLIDHFHHDYLLVMNSDLLTNIDFEDFYREMLRCNADMIVATTGYEVNIPYGVIETNGSVITGLKEKPTYVHYSNAGIYIIKKTLIDFIPENAFYNATDLILDLITNGKKVVHYPMLNYWLDIGRHEDYLKAQEDVKHIKF